MGLSARTTRHAKRDSPGLSSPHPAPKPAEHCYQYDAWNRLRRVFTDADSDDTFDTGEAIHQESRYDGLNRRIVRIAGSDSSWLRTDFYYNASWQIIEEKVSSEQAIFAAAAAASTTARYQYVWDLRYIDSPVLRDEDLDSDGDCTDDEGTGSERLCYANDANFNVTALVETDGSAAERTIYDAYGQPTLYDSTWANTIAESASKANELRICGYVFDAAVGLYTVRYRVYHPTLGRWIQRDPGGYGDGLSLYQYVGARPTEYGDPTGLVGLFTVLFEAQYVPRPLHWYAPRVVAPRLAPRIVPKVSSPTPPIPPVTLQPDVSVPKDSAKTRPDDIAKGAEHTRNDRKSTKGKHEEGRRRTKTDQGGEKGDARRGDNRTPEDSYKDSMNRWRNKVERFRRGLDDKARRSLDKWKDGPIDKYVDHLKRLGFNEGPPPPPPGPADVIIIGPHNLVHCGDGFSAHTVVQGDTCWDLWTKRSDKSIPWSKACSACRISSQSGDPDTLKNGETICIPN